MAEYAPRDVGTAVHTFEFPDRGYAHKYQEWLFEKNADRIRGRVLDVGSEENQQLRYERYGGRINKYVAMDLRADDGLTVQGDACSLPFADSTFDTIILREVLEHIPVGNLETVVSEVHRVIATDGTVFITTPFRFQLHGVGYADQVRLTSEGLQSLLCGAGFSDVRIYKGGGFAESVLSPIQTAWFVLVERVGIAWAKVALAPIHYLLLTVGRPIDTGLVAVTGENYFGKSFYLHNMAIAVK